LEESEYAAWLSVLGLRANHFTIKSCYYEFARRYPDRKGLLFQGFVSASVDKIFESTDSQISKMGVTDD